MKIVVWRGDPYDDWFDSKSDRVLCSPAFENWASAHGVTVPSDDELPAKLTLEFVPHRNGEFYKEEAFEEYLLRNDKGEGWVIFENFYHKLPEGKFDSYIHGEVT